MIADGGQRRLLLVESNHGFRRDLARALTHVGFKVDACASAREAVASRSAASSIVQVVDVSASGALDWLRAHGSAERTIVMVSSPHPPDALRDQIPNTMEVLCKPFSIHTLEARVLARLGAANVSPLRGLNPILVSHELEFEALMARARRLARRELPIVIEGELGTGRRALAEAIHGWSLRAGHPLLSIEGTELASGGKSDLSRSIRERMTAASGGSILIADPADLPEDVQNALVTEMRHFEDKSPRWLTIARGPLEPAVREGCLLLELQYRLDSARLEMPPLRDRPLDHAPLCRAVAERIAREMGESAPAIEASTIEELARDGFPGNLLGLESRLRSCIVRGEGDARRVGQLLSEDTLAPQASESPLASLNLKTLERDTIIRALAHWNGNRTRASEALGISVRTLRNKIRDYGLR